MNKNFENIKPDLTIMGGLGIFGKKTLLLGFTKIGIIVNFYDSEEVKEITKRLLQESKDRGEGKLARITIGFKAGNEYIERISSKTIQEILESNNENFFIPLESISKIKLHKSSDNENLQDHYSLSLKTDKEKYKFTLQIGGDKEKKIKLYCKENYSIKI